MMFEFNVLGALVTAFVAGVCVGFTATFRR